MLVWGPNRGALGPQQAPRGCKMKPKSGKKWCLPKGAGTTPDLRTDPGGLQGHNPDPVSLTSSISSTRKVPK
eukprot:7702778-Karenia_brevis.AAC.1